MHLQCATLLHVLHAWTWFKVCHTILFSIVTWVSIYFEFLLIRLDFCRHLLYVHCFHQYHYNGMISKTFAVYQLLLTLLQWKHEDQDLAENVICLYKVLTLTILYDYLFYGKYLHVYFLVVKSGRQSLRWLWGCLKSLSRRWNWAGCWSSWLLTNSQWLCKTCVLTSSLNLLMTSSPRDLWQLCQTSRKDIMSPLTGSWPPHEPLSTDQCVPCLLCHEEKSGDTTRRHIATHSRSHRGSL